MKEDFKNNIPVIFNVFESRKRILEREYLNKDFFINNPMAYEAYKALNIDERKRIEVLSNNILKAYNLCKSGKKANILTSEQIDFIDFVVNDKLNRLDKYIKHVQDNEIKKELINPVIDNIEKEKKEI